jgi:hypothetical protein
VLSVEAKERKNVKRNYYIGKDIDARQESALHSRNTPKSQAFLLPMTLHPAV